MDEVMLSGAPRFPTMLRKMWSGREVQAWIDARWECQITPAQGDVFELWAIKQGLLLETAGGGAYTSPATQQSFRAFLLGLAQPVVPHWSPISTAPRDGTPVLIKIKSLDKMLAEQRSIEFAGMVFVGSNRNTIMQWGFAAPVGYGGIPDDWIEGWMAVPGVAVPETAT